MTAAPALPVPPLPYHRLLRALPGYGWWKPLVALVITAVLWVVFTLVVVVVGVVIAASQGRVHFDSAARLTTELTALFGTVNAGDPLSISIALIGVATLLPATLLAYLMVGLRPLSVLRSVEFRIRWRWLALCLLPALAITFAATFVQFILVPLFAGGGGPVAPTIPLGTFAVCAAIIVVFTPVQAAAEEFAFRGLTTQMLGSWLRWAPFPIVLSAIPFAASHTQYFGWATAEVGFFALVAGFVTWRTGGLEAGIALHAVNNTVAFLTLASSLGGATSTSAHDSGSWGSFLVTVITMGAYAYWIDRMARRRGIRNRLEPLAVAPAVPQREAAPEPDAAAGNS